MFRARLHRGPQRRLRRVASFLLSVLFTLAPPSSAFAQAPLTLERAVDLAVEHDLSAKLAAVAFAEAQVSYERSLAANLLEAPQARRSAENAFRSATIAYENARADIALATVERYIAVLRGRLDLEVAEKRLEVARIDLAAAERRLALGTASELDLMSAANTLSTATLDLTAAQNAYQRAVQDLAASLGLDVQAGLELSPELPILPFDDELEPAVARALERSANLFSASAALENAQVELELARSEGAPPLELQRLELALRRAELELEQTRQGVERSVTSSYNELLRARDLLPIVEANLAAQERRFAAVQEQFRAGLRSERELLQAEISLAEARADRLDAVRNYLRALLSFRKTIGDPPGVGSALQQGVSANVW